MVRSIWLAMIFIFATAAAQAVEPCTSAPSASPEKGSPAVVAAEAAIESKLADEQAGPIHTLLVNKEFPLTGIKWGGQLFIDLPLNNEPEDAQITLRRATMPKSFVSKALAASRSAAVLIMPRINHTFCLRCPKTS